MLKTSKNIESKIHIMKLPVFSVVFKKGMFECPEKIYAYSTRDSEHLLLNKHN